MSTGSEKMDGGGPVRPGGSVLQRDRSIGLGLILVVAVALVVTVSAPPASAPPSQRPEAAATGSPGTWIPGDATPAPTQTIAPVAWEPVDLGPDAATGIATLEPTKAGIGGVAVDTRFLLTSLDGRPPETLAAALVATPTIDFEVVSTEGATALLRPAAPLRQRTGYRIALVRPDGTTEARWAAVAAGPLTVVGTVPGSESTGVPRDTGIEFTFDQYGVKSSDVARYFSIRPSVEGSFHAGNRTVAFAPDRPLAKGRLYTVTLRHGLPLAGTGEVLEKDVVVRFETRGGSTADVTVGFQHPLADGNPSERTAVTVVIDRRDGAKRPASIPVTIHELPSLSAALDAYEEIRDAPYWTEVSPVAPVRTTDLPRVFKGNLKVHKTEWIRWVELPRLPAGWYVVTDRYPGRADQLLLQVSNVSAFTLLTSDGSVFWVNDVETGRPIDGASVAVDGRRLGATDGRGLLEAATQPIRRAADDEWEDSHSISTAVVRDGGRAAFVPVDAWCGDDCRNPTDSLWHSFSTDREEYRSTDTINAWGIVHDRDTDRVPARVTITLDPYDDESEDADAAGVAVFTATATPDPNGAYLASIPFKGLPPGWYVVTAEAGDAVVGETWIHVTTLVKPAYQLAVSTNRHAAIVGDPVEATVHATFFEDTPVAGTELRLSASGEDEDGDAGSSTAIARTDASGTATASVVVPSIWEEDQWSVSQVAARPTLPEEADIDGWTDIAAFRASGIVDADAVLRGTSLTITGLVSDVAFDRFESADGDLWSVDPRGDPRATPTVRIKVVEETSTKKQTGTSYDFILKRVIPVYDYGSKRTKILEETVTGDADGRFRLTTTVRGGSDRGYDVTVSWTDEAGHTTADDAWASTSDDLVTWERGTWLEDAATGEGSGTYSVGDDIRVRFRGGGGDIDGSSYLYAVTQRGLRYVTVGSSPTFRTPFREAYAPGVHILGARFNGSGYEQVVREGYGAYLDLDDRTLDVALTADHDRYAPGDTATVAIRTTHANGEPVAATVVMRAIDEKLYAMGAAEETRTIESLYGDVGSGLVGWASTHRTPMDDLDDGKGDTTGGGGERSGFRDWLIAKLVTTGPDGRASVTVPLSDDLTSWRVIGTAIDDRLEAGDGTVKLPVGLPFFVEATVAPEYLASDRVAIRVRGFGSGLTAADEVRFTATSDTLSMASADATAPAFEAAEIDLPPLTVGEHRIRIAATVGSGSARRTDVLVRTFTVVSSRTTQEQTMSGPLDGPMPVVAGGGLTRLVLADAGRGRVVPILEALAWDVGPRADDLVAARLAGLVLRDGFGLDDQPVLDPARLDPYRRGGLALLPYSSSDLDVTALAAMTGDPMITADLTGALENVRYDTEQRRDRRLLALAGLAALDPAVLPEIRAAATRTDLEVEERISVALAALNAGDEPLARELLDELLASHGRRYGDLVRVDPGTTADATVQTARLAIVAASLGDPVAAGMDRWVEENPSRFASTSLERALAARGWATRVPGEPAAARLTIGGKRTDLPIEPGNVARISLTPAQAAAATLEPVSGSVLVVQGWASALDTASLTTPDALTLVRAATPTGTIAADEVVVVTLKVTLPTGPTSEGWQVVDLAPSGLVPIAAGHGGEDEEDEDVEGGEQGQMTVGPDRIEGQRVEFTVFHDPARPTQVLRYVARVVTPGTYAWEPAVIQSTLAPSIGLAVPAGTVTITRLAD